MIEKTNINEMKNKILRCMLTGTDDLFNISIQLNALKVRKNK